MQRRKFLIGAGSAAVGASALIGSGAFTSVEAERTVTVDVTGDASAYLSIDASNLPDDYVEENGTNGPIELDFNSLNDDAETTFDSAFTVSNSGTNTVDVTVATPNGVTLESDGTDLDDPGIELGTGENPIDVDITIDTEILSNEDEGDQTWTFNATEANGS